MVQSEHHEGFMVVKKAYTQLRTVVQSVPNVTGGSVVTKEGVALNVPVIPLENSDGGVSQTVVLEQMGHPRVDISIRGTSNVPYRVVLGRGCVNKISGTHTISIKVH